MNNKLTQLFETKQQGLLNIYCTAGFPKLHSTAEVILALQKAGADMVEIGMPYSDPVADGDTIQQSSATALANGMNMSLLFEQLESIKKQLQIPVILMGYINPVLQFGMEKFCAVAKQAGVSAVIIPDLPFYEYQKYYQPLFKKYDIGACFLVSPSSSEKRIKQADKLSSGFLYVVSSASTTGSSHQLESSVPYFEKLAAMPLHNKLMIGFGIKDAAGFQLACRYASGAIIGTAYIKHIMDATNIDDATQSFIKAIRAN